MKIIFLLLALFCLQFGFSQDKSDENYQKAEVEIFGKCFKNLKPIEGTNDILPTKKDIPFCSLYQCVSRIGYAENNKQIEESIVKRAIDITTLLYNEGTPIYLMIGMDSFGEAEEKNQSLTDDHNLVYISIAACISTPSLNKIQKAVNKQTLELINKK